jgi:hypothetical protein
MSIRIGALLTVLAVALDPFSQQLLQYREMQDFVVDPLGQTAITRAQRYSKGTIFRTGFPMLGSK